MEKIIFNPGNLKKFFHTDTTAYTPKVQGLVKALGENYIKSAASVVEALPGAPELCEPIVRGMVSNYATSVALITGGWAGHA